MSITTKINTLDESLTNQTDDKTKIDKKTVFFTGLQSRHAYILFDYIYYQLII